jgi:hypothetical protein
VEVVREIYDMVKNKKKINNSIRKYGCFAEHNFLHYLNCETSEYKNVFFDHGNKGIMMQVGKKTNIWNLFPCGILAPDSEKLDLLLETAEYVLKTKKAKKFTVEVPEDLRKAVLRKMHNGMRASTYTTILYWPVYNMDSWDPKLRGSKMKKLRNIRNRFLKRHRVRVAHSKNVPKQKLAEIFHSWLKKRSVNDSVDKEYYLNLISNNFRGADIAKTIYVDNRPATITAGWKIPNSSNYYSAVGMVDYSYPGLGEMANIDDLSRLKREGFEYVDFGGSDQVLLRFKKKFRPERIYKTYEFSILKR